MNKLTPMKVGAAMAGMFALLHAVWSLLIAFGWAQPFMDFIFKLHMISPVYSVQPFSLGTAAMLVIITSIIGFCIGYAFAYIWNHLHR